MKSDCQAKSDIRMKFDDGAGSDQVHLVMFLEDEPDSNVKPVESHAPDETSKEYMTTSAFLVSLSVMAFWGKFWLIPRRWKFEVPGAGPRPGGSSEIPLRANASTISLPT